jgi:hypothetical protein
LGNLGTRVSIILKGVDSSFFCYNKDQLQTLVKAVLNLQAPNGAWNFLPCCAEEQALRWPQKHHSVTRDVQRFLSHVTEEINVFCHVKSFYIKSLPSSCSWLGLSRPFMRYVYSSRHVFLALTFLKLKPYFLFYLTMLEQTHRLYSPDCL